jgi:uncharacterized phage protein gp47/JayE
MGTGPTPVPVLALTSGQTNLILGSTLSFVVGIGGINGQAPITTFVDGSNGDTVDQTRANVLNALRQPPMGGDGNDYVQWALKYPGCTRAWCSPQEMGIGTVTLRFMMDAQNATDNPMTSGLPLSADIAGMQAFLAGLRPVTVIDLYVEAPIPQAVNVAASNLVTTLSQGATVTSETIDAGTNQNIINSVSAMLFQQGSPAWVLNGVPQPAQNIAAVWISDAILSATNVVQFDFDMSDQVMANPGCIAVMGTLTLT